MRTRIACWSLSIVAGIVAPASAQARRGSPSPSPSPTYEGRVKVGGLYFDNFFETSPGGAEQNVGAARFEGRIGRRLRRASPVEAYVEADYIRRATV